MGEERTREPAEVLQAALLDLIAGARAVLDVIEEVVQDPSGVARVVENTWSGVRAAAGTAAGAASASNGTSDEPPMRPRVTRIRVQ